MRLKTPFAVCATAAMLLIAVPRAGAEGSLATARDLYASASYNEALTMLNSLLAGGYVGEERQSIELYRTLCLLAVGRKADADRVIETMILHDPLYRPAPDDIPPRLLTAFSDARKRMLPAIIQQKYNDAKAAFDRKEYALAVDGFTQVLDGLADPDIAAAAGQSPLSDLRTLSIGFHDLSAKSLAPPVPAPKPEPVVASALTPQSIPRGPRIYGAEDPNIVAPVAIKQAIPPFPGLVRTPVAGIIEVVIDEHGTVESAVMRRSLNPQYDRLAVSAAKGWQYQPAAADGVPVKFRKLVQISLVPSASR